MLFEEIRNFERRGEKKISKNVGLVRNNCEQSN
jgi:hypothetical protein